MKKNNDVKNKIISNFLVLLVVTLLLFSGVNIKNTVLALNGDYDRAGSGDNQIETDDWDFLDEDFLARDGSNEMDNDANIILNGGNIKGLPDIPEGSNDATSKLYVDTEIAGVVGGGSANIINTSGENLKMVCGETSFGSTEWAQVFSNTITLLVDTSSASFASDDVAYSVSLYGDGSMYEAVGYNGIYQSSATSFRIYVTNNLLNTLSAVSVRDNYKWYIRWCGVGK
jgi:hypothetical protein